MYLLVCSSHCSILFSCGHEGCRNLALYRHPSTQKWCPAPSSSHRGLSVPPASSPRTLPSPAATPATPSTQPPTSLATVPTPQSPQRQWHSTGSLAARCLGGTATACQRKRLCRAMLCMLCTLGMCNQILVRHQVPFQLLLQREVSLIQLQQVLYWRPVANCASCERFMSCVERWSAGSGGGRR